MGLLTSYFCLCAGYEDYKMFLETSVKVDPPTETDVSSYSVVASRTKKRYDILQFNDEDYEYKQVLAIFSLRRYKSDGYYSSRNERIRIVPIDTFLICADMVQVPSIGVQRLSPYTMFKMKKGSRIINIFHY